MLSIMGNRALASALPGFWKASGGLVACKNVLGAAGRGTICTHWRKNKSMSQFTAEIVDFTEQLSLTKVMC